MQKRNVLNSPRLLELKKKRARVFINKVLLSVLAILLIFACLAYISRISSFNINEIEIVDNKTTDTETVRDTVKKEMAGNYLLFLPKTNILLYPRNNIKNSLSNEFKRFKNIDLSVKSNGVLEVSITERDAAYTWCGITPNLVVGLPSGDPNTSKCYFMDETGYIYDEAPYFSGEIYFKFYGQGSTGSYFSEESFKKLISFKNALVPMGLNPTSLYILDNGDIKVFLSKLNKITAAPYVTFKVDEDFQSLVDNLQSAISAEPLLSDLKNKYDSLEYIDLRFGNKVYYKFH